MLAFDAPRCRSRSMGNSFKSGCTVSNVASQSHKIKLQTTTWNHKYLTLWLLAQGVAYSVTNLQGRPGPRTTSSGPNSSSGKRPSLAANSHRLATASAQPATLSPRYTLSRGISATTASRNPRALRAFDRTVPEISFSTPPYSSQWTSSPLGHGPRAAATLYTCQYLNRPTTGYLAIKSTNSSSWIESTILSASSFLRPA
ncbi:hypothetical protein C8Q78DRAFT_674218 [Trametes maxima]|nr:hypothetical protein C8Q78DRAFT_674218 [Trametes maxima]